MPKKTTRITITGPFCKWRPRFKFFSLGFYCCPSSLSIGLGFWLIACEWADEEDIVRPIL